MYCYDKEWTFEWNVYSNKKYQHYIHIPFEILNNERSGLDTDQRTLLLKETTTQLSTKGKATLMVKSAQLIENTIADTKEITVGYKVKKPVYKIKKKLASPKKDKRAGLR